MKFFPTLLLACCVLSSQAHFRTPTEPVTPISNSPEMKQLVMDALDKMYNFEHEACVEKCKEIRKRLPSHPIFHMLMAMNIDWQWEPAVKDKVLLGKLHAHLNEAVKEANYILYKENKNDAEALFIYFTAQGFLARVSSFSGEWMRAVNYSLNAYQTVKQGFKLKEKFADFYFSTGMYNYYRQRYPELQPVVKPFAGLLEPGNAELGIKQIRLAHKTSLFSKIESINYLVNIYFKYEGKPNEIMPELAEAVKKYPGNLFLQHKYADGLLWTGKVDGVLAIISKLFKANNDYYDMAGFTFLAKLHLKAGKVDEALKAIQFADNHNKRLPKTSENIPGYIYQVYGQIYTLKGNKAEAHKYYKLCEQHAEYPSLKREAKEWIKQNLK
ncbi:MAG: hypothetical protein EXR21_00115 [Flavobacteriaceae bacterium]|nr:hypothetical protein [Flavobacteriaceae bacterium]